MEEEWECFLFWNGNYSINENSVRELIRKWHLHCRSCAGPIKISDSKRRRRIVCAAQRSSNAGQGGYESRQCPIPTWEMAK